jgi:hypothetical protein
MLAEGINLIGGIFNLGVVLKDLGGLLNHLVTEIGF